MTVPRPRPNGKELRFTFPLADDREAILWLPRVLTREDGERMQAFIAALVIFNDEDEQT